MSINVQQLNRWIADDPNAPVTRRQLAILLQSITSLENLTDVLFDRLAVVSLYAMGPSHMDSAGDDPTAAVRALTAHTANRGFAEAVVVSLCRIADQTKKRRGSLADIAKMFGVDTSGPTVEELMAQAEKDRKGGTDDG